MIRRVACVARDATDERMLHEPVERDPFADRGHPHPLLDALATGRSRLVEHPDGPDMPAVDALHRELMEHFSVKSTVLAPLRARGRTLGVMALGFAEVGRLRTTWRWSRTSARRAALAIDNARLYEERANVARTLQRTLLPPVLPDVPGIELAARYVAAGEGNEVGGDFYDLFRTGDGEWAVAIGDVCGKGAEAAAVTALARYTAARVGDAALRPARRGAAGPQRRASAARRRTAASAPSSTSRSRCTATASPACVASGGHPLPLILRADGRVETAGCPARCSGSSRPRSARRTLVLRPGDSMILYTDGVMEASPSTTASAPSSSPRVVSECHGRAPIATARHIEDAVLDVQGGTVRDDVAVLVLRVRPSSPCRLSRTSRG